VGCIWKLGDLGYPIEEAGDYVMALEAVQVAPMVDQWVGVVRRGFICRLSSSTRDVSDLGIALDQCLTLIRDCQ